MQVLTFLRTERRAKNYENELSTWICLLGPVFKAHLKKKGIKIHPDFFHKMSNIYKTSYKKPSPHLFLSANSKLAKIPTGDKWRSSPECVYSRATMIERCVLSPATLQILDKGILQLFLIRCNKCFCYAACATKSQQAQRSGTITRRRLAHSFLDTNTPRLKRLQKRGPGSATRQWCKSTHARSALKLMNLSYLLTGTITGSPISPRYTWNK